MKKRFVETLLSAGFTEVDIMNITKIPKSSVYRIVDNIKSDEYSIYNLSNNEELKNEITNDFKALLENCIFDDNQVDNIKELFCAYKDIVYLNSNINYTHIIKVCVALKNFANENADDDFMFYLDLLLRDFITSEYKKIMDKEK